MDLDGDRVIFWKEFILFKNSRGNLSVFNANIKLHKGMTHAAEVYVRNGIRLVVGVNEEYSRCSLHFTGSRLNEIYSNLKKNVERINKEIYGKRSPELTVKRNVSSVVLMLNDYGYHFPPPSLKEKEALMEWMYQNSIVMDAIPSIVGLNTIQKQIMWDIVDSEQLPSKAIVPFDQTTTFKAHDYSELKKKIYACNENCKQPIDQMLLGRLMTGKPGLIDLMLIGLGPNISYAEKSMNREVFGEYSLTGNRVEKLLSAIHRKKGVFSSWGTNAIKCDYDKKNENETIFRCKKYLLKEIEILNPKVIVLFGSRLSHLLINMPVIHGRVHTLFNKYPCIQSVHPASRSDQNRFDENNIYLLTNKIIEFL